MSVIKRPKELSFRYRYHATLALQIEMTLGYYRYVTFPDDV